jgi:hypothetical protein
MATRREAMKWTAAAAAAAALAHPVRALAQSGRGTDEETVRHLHELILQRALDGSDPWLEMHVVLALGADIANQRGNVLDQAVAQALELSPAGFRRVPHFPLAVERHPFHFLQVMQAKGVPEGRVFVTPLGRFTHREILEGSEALLVPADVSDELSWVVSVLTRAFPPSQDKFVNARGETVVVSQLALRHLRETESAYAGTFAAMEGKALYKRGPLHTKACNGTHLLYGLIDAVAAGYETDDLKSRVERLIAATLFRMKVEPILIDKSLPGDLPMVRLNADAAKFTFLGHVIEDLGQAYRQKVLAPTPEQLQVIGQARLDLGRLVDRLTGEHDLDALKAEVPNAYRVLLGDSCHAFRGMELWLRA